MTDNIPRRHLALAKECDRLGDVEGWLHHMRLCHAAMKDRLQKIRQRVELIDD